MLQPMSTSTISAYQSKVYDQFSKEIDEVYARLENNSGRDGTLVLDQIELELWLIQRVHNLGFDINRCSNFFAAGLDSLRATQIRGIILKHLNLGGRGSILPNMIIYECGNIENLAQRLIAVRTGTLGEKKDNFALIRSMVEKYSVVPDRICHELKSSQKAVIVRPRLRDSLSRLQRRLTFPDTDWSYGIPWLSCALPLPRSSPRIKDIYALPNSKWINSFRTS